MALNAYVISARTLADEQPECGITWSMLAGIGHVESFHGHFGDSTLDINGHTTEDIRGPALDGRILKGAEQLGPDSDTPGPTGRTEDLNVPAPAPAAPGESPADAAAAPAPEAPAPAAAAPATPAPPQPAGDAPANAAQPTNGAEPSSDAAEAPAPEPVVIRRLALIVDSDGGELDSDTTFDRAVGPMQFIPSTWRLFEQDGNLDEELDPQNIYDASLASARYLCASTPTMTTLEGELQAYFAYNHDVEYSQNVHRTGQRYAGLIDVYDPTTNGGDMGRFGGDANSSSVDDGTWYRGLADPDRVTTEEEILQSLSELDNFDLLNAALGETNLPNMGLWRRSG